MYTVRVFQTYMSQDAYRPTATDDYMLDESVREMCDDMGLFARERGAR